MAVETLAEENVYLLPIDEAILAERVESLRQKSSEIAEVVQEAIEQSSETTHDNAPYDVARQEYDIAQRRLADLLRVQKLAVVVPVPTVAEAVTIGTVATLSADDEEVRFEVAGDWHGRSELEDPLVVNRSSPVAMSIIGRRTGEIVNLRNKTWKLTEVVPSVGQDIEVNENGVTPTVEAPEWCERRILFVTGPHASGKSSVIKEAFDPESFTVIDTGPVLREIHATTSDLSFAEWVKQGETEYGSDFTNELLRKHIETALSSNGVKPQGLIVIGNRSIQGINYLRTNLDNSTSKILYVNAPKKMMYERYKSREGKKNLKSAEFDEIIAAEMRQGLFHIASIADLKLLNVDELPVMAEKARKFVNKWTDEEN